MLQLHLGSITETYQGDTVAGANTGKNDFGFSSFECPEPNMS